MDLLDLTGPQDDVVERDGSPASELGGESVGGWGQAFQPGPSKPGRAVTFPPGSLF